MALYRRIKKIDFEDGTSYKFSANDLAIYDSIDVINMQEEDMSIKVIKPECSFSIEYTDEWLPHPLRNEAGDFLPILDSLDIDNLINQESDDREYNADVSSDFTMTFLTEKVNGKTVPFLQISAESEDANKSAYIKVQLNHTKLNHIVRSIRSLKSIIDDDNITI